MLDISQTLIAKSDQLNADDLIMGAVIVRITGVRVKDTPEQPVEIDLSGGYRPWRPCKTMRRVLAHGWGTDASKWQGKWMRLYRDAAVRFGKDEVGGIRISGMSDIAKPIAVNLNAAKGKKAMHHVEILTPPTSDGTKQDRAAALSRWCNLAVKEGGWTVDQVKALLGNRPAKDIPVDEHEKLIAALKGQPPSAEGDPDAEAFEREVPPADDDAYQGEHGEGEE